MRRNGYSFGTTGGPPLKLPRGKITSTHSGGLEHFQPLIADLQSDEFSGYMKIAKDRDNGTATGHVILRDGDPVGCIHSYEGDRFGTEAINNIALDVQDQSCKISIHKLDPSMILSFYPELKVDDFLNQFARATSAEAPEPSASEEEGAVEEAVEEERRVEPETETETETVTEAGTEIEIEIEQEPQPEPVPAPADAAEVSGEDEGAVEQPAPEQQEAVVAKEAAGAAGEPDGTTPSPTPPSTPTTPTPEATPPAPASGTTDGAGAATASQDADSAAPEKRTRERIETSALNPDFTFENFIVGDNNRFTHAAARAVAETPSDAYNPLFIYGGVGLGKTHLLTAIGNYILKRDPTMRIVYVTSEKFMNELINSIRYDEINEFRARYRTVDVLLIDDIQFLAGKESTQEEFFHTFNALYNEHKQIVITSDRLPKDITTLEDRLRSRFEGGLITDMQPPNLETRAAILRKKIAAENIDIPNEITKFIAEHVCSNIRELEGSLTKVIAYAELTNAEITMDLAQHVLRDILEDEEQKRIEQETSTRQQSAKHAREDEEIFQSLKLGRSYLVEEERPDLSFKLLEYGAEGEWNLFCIARTNPRQIRDSYALEEAPIYWLTDRDSEKEQTITPSLESIIYYIQETIDETPNIIVMIEGLEFLIDNNGFNPVIRFLRQLIDDISERDAILLIPISPYVLDDQELKSLEREMIPITKAISRASSSKSFAQAFSSLEPQ